MAVEEPVDLWEQAIADIGWELQYISIPTVDGAVEIADVARQIETRNADGWALMLIGHDPDNGATQLCFRRAVPDRDEHVRQARLLKAQMLNRHN